MINTLIEANRAGTVGGGLAVDGGAVELTGTTSIDRNKADHEGGGVALNQATLTGGTLEANEATIGGAGIVAYGTSGLLDLVVRGHNATKGSVYLSGGTYKIQGLRVTENNGYEHAGISLYRAKASMISVEVSNNVASYIGGGIALDSSVLDMEDSVIILNEARSGSGIYMSGSELNLIVVDLGDRGTDNVNQDISNQGTTGSVHDYAWDGTVEGVHCDDSGKCTSLAVLPL